MFYESYHKPGRKGNAFLFYAIPWHKVIEAIDACRCTMGISGKQMPELFALRFPVSFIVCPYQIISY